MANNIGWGKGASSNSIGWGQGVINNIINWGKIYYSTWVGETDIIGSPVPNIIDAFKVRVATESGVFEAQTCLNTTLTNLNNL